MKHKVEKEYIINEFTMAILPFYSDNGELQSKVIEKFRVILVAKTPKVIINESCIFYGGDLLGNMKSASSILIGKKMLPIMISVTHRICMVPLSSPHRPKCVWIALHHVLRVSAERDQAYILFPNQKKVKVDLTEKTLNQKFNVAGRLVSIYDDRKEPMSGYHQKEVAAEQQETYSIDYEKFDY